MIPVTVVVLTYNRAIFLADSIRSIVNQTKKPAEIYVLDNCSTDNTEEICSDFLDDIIYLKNETNIGGIGSFRRAMSLGSCPLIMIFHDDDILYSNALELLYNNITRSAGIVAVGGVIQFENKPLFREVNKELFIKCKSQEDLVKLFWRGVPVGFCSFIYKREVLLMLDVEESTYGKYFDRPFLISLARFGTVSINLNSVLDYRVHPGQDSSFVDNISHLKSLHAFYIRILKSKGCIYILYLKLFERVNYLTRNNVKLSELGLNHLEYYISYLLWKIQCLRVCLIKKCKLQ